MKNGYWIVSADVTDAEKFKNYATKTPAALAQFGGRFLLRSDSYRLVEGSSRARNAVIEFPSYQAAIDCWESEAYQSAKLLRVGGAEMDIVIIEGCDE